MKLAKMPQARLWVALFSFFSAAGPLSSQVIDLRLTVQPIQITNGTGLTGNVSETLFSDYTNKIFAQAGIEVHFLPFVTYTNSSFTTVSASVSDSNYLGQLSAIAANPANSTLPWRNETNNSGLSNKVVRLFFAPSISGGALGFTLQTTIADLDLNGSYTPYNQQNYSVISNAAFTYNSNNGRKDVVAHELGHLFGLSHENDFSGYPVLSSPASKNLMASGGIRQTPTSLNDVFPDGNDYDFLTNNGAGGQLTLSGLTEAQLSQVNILRMSSLLTPITPYNYGAVPEPEVSAMMAGVAALAVGGWRRRLNRRHSVRKV